jgi:hypothetical protein
MRRFAFRALLALAVPSVRLLCWIAVAAVALGCSRDKPPPPDRGSAAPAAPVALPPAPAPAPAGVELFVDDARVAVIAPAQLASWPRLDSLVPDDARRLGTWAVVSLQAGGARPTDVPRPSTTYPDMVPAVFPGPDGASFGMFDPVELARKGKPALRADAIQAIRIKLSTGGGRGQNDDGGGGGGDPTKLVVAVTTPAGAKQLTGEQLLALPREPMPGNPDQKGWRLSALLTAAGVSRFQRLVLRDASGANLTLDKKDLSETSIPFIKLNKQGALRFRVFKKAGGGWDPTGDLRGLVSIDVK